MPTEFISTDPPVVPADVDLSRARLRRAESTAAQANAYRAYTRRLAHELGLTQRLLAHYMTAAMATSATVGPLAPAGIVRIPTAKFVTDDLEFCLDLCEKDAAHTRLDGWAFCPIFDCQSARITVLFQSADATFAAVTTPVRRPDVATAFAGQTFPAPAPIQPVPWVWRWAIPPRAPPTRRQPLNLEFSGFRCVVAHAALPPGEYELFLHVECDGWAAQKFTQRRLVF